MPCDVVGSETADNVLAQLSCAVQYSAQLIELPQLSRTVQYSTVQYSAVQYSAQLIEQAQLSRTERCFTVHSI